MVGRAPEHQEPPSDAILWVFGFFALAAMISFIMSSCTKQSSYPGTNPPAVTKPQTNQHKEGGWCPMCATQELGSDRAPKTTRDSVSSARGDMMPFQDTSPSWLLYEERGRKNTSLWGKTFSLSFDTWHYITGICFLLSTLVQRETSRGARRNPSLALMQG